MTTARLPVPETTTGRNLAEQTGPAGAVIHMHGATLEVVSEQLITCERVRMVNGKPEHYAFQYTACTVRKVVR
jgi:hypothetical protein